MHILEKDNFGSHFLNVMEFFDSFSDKYDLMITWPQRIEHERPFFQTIFNKHHISNILDAGCGTGNHTIEFTKWGKTVIGCDISSKMIEQAKINAAKENLSIQFEVAAFQELRTKLNETFDAIICIGNNLPQILKKTELHTSLQNMYQLLRKDGICIIQNQNYDRILKKNQKFLPLKSATQGDKEYLFFRMLELHEEPISFYIITLEKNQKGIWNFTTQMTKLMPWRKNQLEKIFLEVGFQTLEVYGSYKFDKFDESTSTDLILIAHA